MFGKCDAFIDLEYKNQTKTSVVVKNSLDPDWKPEEIFEFDLSKGELVDLKVTLKDWNRLTAVKTLGTTVLPAARLRRVLDGEPEPRLGSEFFVTGVDGEPLKGQDGEQTFLVLKLAPREGFPRARTSSADVAQTMQIVKDAAVLGAPEVGATNLFNTPSKTQHSLENTPGPPFHFMCDIDDHTPPVSNSSSRQHTPNLKSSLDPKSYQTVIQTNGREASRRMLVQDRRDDFWDALPRSSSLTPRSSPSLLYSSQPHSLHADSPRYISNTYTGAPRLARITLADRGITATSDFYMRDESGPQTIGTEVGQDATVQLYSTASSAVNRRSAVTRERELKGAGRVLQDYRYHSSKGRLERNDKELKGQSSEQFKMIQDGTEWQAVRDPSTGKIFFVNHVTKQRSWVDPRSSVSTSYQTARTSSSQNLYSSAPSSRLQPGSGWSEQPLSNVKTTSYNQENILYTTDPGVSQRQMHSYPSLPPSSSTSRRSGWTPYVASSNSARSVENASYVEYAGPSIYSSQPASYSSAGSLIGRRIPEEPVGYYWPERYF